MTTERRNNLRCRRHDLSNILKLPAAFLYSIYHQQVKLVSFTLEGSILRILILVVPVKLYIYLFYLHSFRPTRSQPPWDLAPAPPTSTAFPAHTLPVTMDTETMATVEDIIKGTSSGCSGSHLTDKSLSPVSKYN